MTEYAGVAEGEGAEDVELPVPRGLGPNGDGQAGVTVLFFAGAREAARTRRASFQAPTVAKLIEQLKSAYGPELEALLPTCAVWVNGSPAGPGTRLEDGDEVAVLPPVSGGCEVYGPPWRRGGKARNVRKRR